MEAGHTILDYCTVFNILQEVNKMCKKEHEKQDKELMKAFCRAEKVTFPLLMRQHSSLSNHLTN